MKELLKSRFANAADEYEWKKIPELFSLLFHSEAGIFFLFHLQDLTLFTFGEFCLDVRNTTPKVKSVGPRICC